MLFKEYSFILLCKDPKLNQNLSTLCYPYLDMFGIHSNRSYLNLVVTMGGESHRIVQIWQWENQEFGGCQVHCLEKGLYAWYIKEKE